MVRRKVERSPHSLREGDKNRSKRTIEFLLSFYYTLYPYSVIRTPHRITAQFWSMSAVPPFLWLTVRQKDTLIGAGTNLKNIVPD